MGGSMTDLQSQIEGRLEKVLDTFYHQVEAAVDITQHEDLKQTLIQLFQEWAEALQLQGLTEAQKRNAYEAARLNNLREKQ